ncbi:hypothetical protein A167_00036 [Alcanivorax sp. S71-1-4]|uniref:HNH/ENDO VII family nuclease n=1 Tax=Alcanivorax sp. S71-1-4 TaxID=1177159 RepID=UPI0016B61CAC|nr:HNH/ENDO VII family nuclease [Alcanivorax sp. S71-1-4]KAF0811004.1 hypothetical protein A167_00036 [Alcanivorax sp. S71-1-4]
MMLESFLVEKMTYSENLLAFARDMSSVDVDIVELDKPFSVTQETRKELAPLSDEKREKLIEKGWGEKTVDAIGSEKECEIYEYADLSPIEVNGGEALVRTDVDYDKKDIFGKTNLERMQDGRPPLDANTKPVELHHIGQKPDSPLAELTQKEHRGAGNDNILHDKMKESEIDRESFAKERAEYWKARADKIIGGS